MRGLDRASVQIEGELDGKDRAREASLRAARAITRLAGDAIRGMHRGEDPARALASLRRSVADLRSLLRGHPDLWHSGAVEGALQEAAEAAIVHRIVAGRPLPTPRSLGIPSAAYLLGLADAVGEIRRFAVDAMRHGRIEEAGRHLQTMEDLFHVLVRFDYPDAIVAVRHKQDVARGLLERTRGELAVATRSSELERKLARLARE